MIIDILNFVNKTGDFSAKRISKEFNMPLQIAEDIKIKLIQMGYIEKFKCNKDICKKCLCGCAKKKEILVEWEITEKGRKVLNHKFNGGD